MFFRKSKKIDGEKISPSLGEIREAKKFPNGNVYRIDKRYDPDGQIPPYAIEGTWPVEANGTIEKPFIKNPNYDEAKIASCELKRKLNS